MMDTPKYGHEPGQDPDETFDEQFEQDFPITAAMANDRTPREVRDHGTNGPDAEEGTPQRRVETLHALVRAVLAEHGPSGSVNSREGWVECECGARLRLPSGMTFDGYPEMWDEEPKARDAHVADILAPLVDQIIETAVDEALTVIREGLRRGFLSAADLPTERSDKS